MTFEQQCLEEREQVVEAGGLHIMGTERHESRRIDNQLRGRSGRQGDSGSSQFFLSLEDDLLRIFESERVAQWWDRVGVEDGEAIENKLLTRVIENAQTKVEARNFDIRKHLLDYDDVMNKQRQAFYSRRREMLGNSDIHEEVLEMAEGVLVAALDDHLPEKGDPEPDDLVSLAASVEAHFGAAMDVSQEPFVVDGRPASDRDALGRAIFDRLSAFIESKQKACDALAEEHAAIGYPTFQKMERDILLQILDAQWKDHLHTMDGLREGVSLRGYASRDPKLEYQREGYALFEEMNQRIDTQAADVIFKFALPEPVPQGPARSLPGTGPGVGAAGSFGFAVAGRARRPRRAPTRRRARSGATIPVRAARAASTRSAAEHSDCATRREAHPLHSRSRLFKAAGVHCGVKEAGLDLALIASDAPARAAGVFTQSTVVGAPVELSRDRIRAGSARAVVINSGVSNVAMGAQGLRDAAEMAQRAGSAIGVPAEQVLVASTGVIGSRLPMPRIRQGIRAAAAGLEDPVCETRPKPSGPPTLLRRPPWRPRMWTAAR